MPNIHEHTLQRHGDLQFTEFLSVTRSCVMMRRETGNIGFPIWLLGDSNPARWQDVLETPFDPRHPIRHNIWTSILDEMQDRVYRINKRRIDTKQLYIRNAVDAASKKPAGTAYSWPLSVVHEIEEFRSLVHNHQPALILCFGAFSFEFSRRALEETPFIKYGAWNTERLGMEFKSRIEHFDLSGDINIPLLHRSIAGRSLLQSHNRFCQNTGANYFRETGIALADLLIRHQHTLPVWIDP